LTSFEVRIVNNELGFISFHFGFILFFLDFIFGFILLFFILDLDERYDHLFFLFNHHLAW